ncbi:MAG: endonuclease III [Solobacterium sp.]|nr:endonuclease III [Solobacterium sp.]
MKTEEVLNALDELFPDAHCELEHRNHYEMAVAVVLSAQTTDASVNRVTPALFERYPDAASLAAGKLRDIEACIASLGLYRNKARSIQGMAQGIVERFNGEVPDNMEDLVTLPGVGRKCANVIMSECYGVPALAVDTHVSRVSRRLGLAKPEDSLLQVEQKLKRKIPKDRWIKSHHQMIFFGRYLCHARNPECDRCPFQGKCRIGKVK